MEPAGEASLPPFAVRSCKEPSEGLEKSGGTGIASAGEEGVIAGGGEGRGKGSMLSGALGAPPLDDALASANAADSASRCSSATLKAWSCLTRSCGVDRGVAMEW